VAASAPHTDRAELLTGSAAGLLLCGALLGLTRATWLGPDLARPQALLFYLGAFLIYGALTAWLWRRKTALPLPLVLGVAAALRLITLFSLPLFSDDIWRYLWDGHVQLAGVNPYAFAPGDAALDALHTPYHGLINHPDVPSIYPPVAQAMFLLSALLGGHLASMRVLILLAEAVGAAAIPLLAEAWRQRHLPSMAPAPWRDLALLLYLWNPLIVVEYAGSGHLDALAVAPLLWALAVTVPHDAPRLPAAPRTLSPWLAAGALIGLSAGAKILGLVALPFLAARALWPAGVLDAHAPAERPLLRLGRVTALAAGTAAVITLTFTPWLAGWGFDQGGSFTQGFSTYARKWRWNDGPYALVHAGNEALLGLTPTEGLAGPEPVWRMERLQAPMKALGVTHVHEGHEVVSTTTTLYEVAANTAKALGALALLLLALLLLNQRVAPDAATLAMITVALMAAPVVHPWYVAWLVPLAAARGFAPLLLWSATVVLSYSIDIIGLSGWVRGVEYAPVVVWALVAAWRRLATPR